MVKISINDNVYISKLNFENNLVNCIINVKNIKEIDKALALALKVDVKDLIKTHLSEDLKYISHKITLVEDCTDAKNSRFVCKTQAILA